MQYKFRAYGHENITGRHKTTLEFTKDKDLTLRGDCIVGVKADFSLPLLKKFISKLKTNKIRIIIELKNKESLRKNPLKNKIIIKTNNNDSLIEKSLKNKSIIKNSLKKINNNEIIKEEIIAEINPDFDSDRGMVIRKSDFKDERTFAVKADKGARDLGTELKEYLKKQNTKINVILKLNIS